MLENLRARRKSYDHTKHLGLGDSSRCVFAGDIPNLWMRFFPRYVPWGEDNENLTA
jgi:hypothetical protein